MNDKNNKLLYNNLAAISERSNVLDTRIRWPVELSHLTLDNRKKPLYHHHLSWLPFETPQEVMAADCNTADNHIFLFGIGYGEYIHSIFKTNSKATISVWERDPALLRFVLMHHDFSSFIRTGRLKILLGVDLVIKYDSLNLSKVLYHPFFSQIYHHERSFLENRSASDFVALALGGLFVDDLAQALGKEGFQVWPVDLQRWSKEELQYTIAALNPKFLASINYVNGTAEFCEHQQLPFFCWEIDPSMDLSLKINSCPDNCAIFTYRQENVSLFKNAGFSTVKHLPLASNTMKRKPVLLDEEDNAKYAVPVAFVGRSMVPESQLYRKKFVELYRLFKNNETDAEDKCEQLIQNILDKQLDDGSFYIVPELYRAVFPGFSDFLYTNNININPEKIIAQIAAAERRLHYVAALGDLGIHVWGDNDWKPVEQYGARYVGFAGHDHELTKIYSAATINIDINRLYQLDIVTMRVFDVLACGGFLIAEYSDELADLFSLGKELESFRTLEELREKILYFQKNPVERKGIADRGLKAVKERHTFTLRVKTILNTLNIQAEAGPSNRL